LTPLQARYHEISDDQVEQILQKGAEQVAPLAQQKIAEVYKKVGFSL
jgi:hypothetical protein